MRYGEGKGGGCLGTFIRCSSRLLNNYSYNVFRTFLNHASPYLWPAPARAQVLSGMAAQAQGQALEAHQLAHAITVVQARVCVCVCGCVWGGGSLPRLQISQS